MARQQKNQDAKTKDAEKVEVLSNAPIEKEPEEPGTMTAAASNAAPRDPVNKGASNAVLEGERIAAERIAAERIAAEKKSEAEAKANAATKAKAEAVAAGEDEAKVKAAGEAEAKAKAERELAEMTEAEVKAADPESSVKYYVVLADKYISGNGGFRAKLRAGKEISSKNYNITKLKRQGVRLEPIEAPEQY